MIISVYAVKYLHALFSKHGASDAKTQEEPALLGQEALVALAGEAER